MLQCSRNQPSLLEGVGVLLPHSHHRESLSGSSLPVGEYATIVALKTVNGTVEPHSLKDLLLALGSPNNGIKLVVPAFVAVGESEPLGAILEFDAGPAVLEKLSFAWRSHPDGHLDGLLF